MAIPTLIPQAVRNETVSVSGTSVPIMSLVPSGAIRTQFAIIPLSAGVTVTIAKGDQAAVANAGIVLIQNQPYVEATDGGYICWQGPVQIVASGAGSVAVMESWVQQI